MISRNDIEQIFSSGSRPLIMGILNLDPESFYAESIAHSEFQALKMVELKLEAGMDILDLGAFSSRPGAKIPNETIESQLIMPNLKAIRTAFPNLPISIDTMRATIAKNCLDLGADIINDISGGIFDEELPLLVAQRKAVYIAMHMNGIPENMQSTNNTNYNNVVEDLLRYFQHRVSMFKSIGLHKLILDPGFGFSKKLQDNYRLLRHLELFNIFEKPILVGVSRKSMIWKVTNSSASDSLVGSIVAGFYAILNGCSILRVHDVKETADMLQIYNAINQSESLKNKKNNIGF